MAYTLPTYNLLANQWGAYDPATTNYSAPDDTDVPCNLTPGKRVMVQSIPRITAIDGMYVYAFPMELLMPVRKVWLDASGIGPGLFEVEQGSGILYLCTYADKIGKGFANEHTFVILHRLAVDVVFADVTIPAPYPYV